METRKLRWISRWISTGLLIKKVQTLHSFGEIPFFRWYFVIFSSFFLLLLVKFDNDVEFLPSIQPEHCANRLCHAWIQFIRGHFSFEHQILARNRFINNKIMNSTFVAIISSLIFRPALSLSWSNNLISNSHLVSLMLH